MANDEQQLLIALEARTRDLERGMRKAVRISDQRFNEIDRRASKSSKHLQTTMGKAAESVASSAKGLLAAFGGGFIGGFAAGGLESIVSNLGEVAKGVAEIGDQAKRAGLSTKSFQELAFVADQNRISVDALTDGMKELSLRADEWIVTGGGSAAEAFNRLGYSATELKAKLKDPSALLVDIIGRLGQLDRAARIRITDEVFGGTAGERFVELVDQGADSIRNTIKEANDLGVVLDEKVVKEAQRIDREFGKITATISTGLKREIVELASAMANFADQFNSLNEQRDDTILRQLQGIYEKRQDLMDSIAKLEAQGGDDRKVSKLRNELAKLTEEALKLRDILDRRNGLGSDRTGKDAADAAPKVSNLANTLAATGSSAMSGAQGLNSFADAIRALQDEVPGLAASLAQADLRRRIDATYNAAVAKARSTGEVQFATQMRDQALTAANVKAATSNSTGYLGNYLAAGRGQSAVSGMQGDFASALAAMIASAPDAVRSATTISSGFRSFQKQAELWDAAVKKYGSEAEAQKWVAPPGKSQHNAGNAADLSFGTDQAKSWFHDNASSFGLSFPLGNEPWHIESASARQSADDEAFKAKYEAMQDQATAYRQIIADAQQFTAQQQTEQQALGMTATQAAALRYEQELLNRAQAAGISLSPQQKQELSQLAQGMAEVEQATLSAAESQDQLRQAQDFLGQSFAGIFTGIITGSMTAEDALKRLVDQLLEAVIQASLLGSGPLAGVFGTAKGGGLFGAIFTALGFSKGGAVHAATGGHISGPGSGTSDSIPAMLSDGEFVVNAKATAQNRRLLEAINSGARLPGFAAGGSVGKTPMSAATGNSTMNFAPTINVDVKGSAGTPEQNSDLAKRVGRQVEGQVRSLVVQELMIQQRPGGLLSGRR